MSSLLDRTFQIIVHGCRTNQYEGEAIASMLERSGARYSEESPDIIVFVTCTITAVADRKCRKQIRKLRREHEKAVLVVCGCYAQNMAEAERGSLGVDLCVGNRRKERIPQLLADFIQTPGRSVFEADRAIGRSDAWDRLTLDRPRMHTRAFLKVQDGCNHYCGYCIVPYVRGKPVARDFDESVEEARRIVGSGCPEIVLTGIHLGLYEKLADLVRTIGAIPGLKRLRFGSLEPFAVDETLLDALAETPAFCPHLHLPLQSGDDGVLASMNRGYTAAEFANIVERARKKLGDRLHVSTDLMVAFPTEDEKAFENSLRFVRETAFGKVHVFPYSPRRGTKAALLEQLPVKLVRERVARALDLAAQLNENYCSAWIGEPVSVLVEEVAGGAYRGLTRHFVRAAGLYADLHAGMEITVTPKRYQNETLFCGDIENPLPPGEHTQNLP